MSINFPMVPTMGFLYSWRKYMRVNWKDKKSVILYAEKLGRGMTVFKAPDRDNYNITHTARRDRYAIDGYEIIHQT